MITFKKTVHRLGPLRVMLVITTLLVIAATPWADGRMYIEDWRIVPSIIAPSIMMMIAFALPLDITMSMIFAHDAQEPERSRLRFVMRFQAVLWLVMLAAWMPFMLKVLDFWPLT